MERRRLVQVLLHTPEDEVAQPRRDAAVDEAAHPGLPCEVFESERIRIPNDRELIAQLTSIRYSFTSMGQMKVEDKDSLRRQGLASPDKADALMLAFAAHKLSNNYKIWV